MIKERIEFVIQAENLFFSYTGTSPYILNGICLTIQNGEYISVIGENGSGKSTLIKLILNFLKPVSGTIVSDFNKLGYVPQKSDFLNSGFPITVFEVLNSYRKLLKIKNPKVVGEQLALVGMEGYSGELIGNLSGGQCQKILIARALMGSPELLILDEPSAGVDVNSQQDIYDFLKKANRENGITIISVEHNLNAALKNSSAIYHLVGGHGHLCSSAQYLEEYVKEERREPSLV